MTPHDAAVSVEVGVRELRDQLSRYVRHAAEGGEVVVTMRGRPIARLAGIDATDPLADLRARGLVREPVRSHPRRAGRSLIKAGGSVSDLVAAQRR